MSTPSSELTAEQGRAQSLAVGHAGEALLHLTRAQHGTGTWATAHQHLRRATRPPIDGGAHASLYYGAPAISFILTAAPTHPGCVRHATALDEHVQRITRTRLATAQARHDTGQHTHFAEYDLFYGLAGLAALLIARHRARPGADDLADTLTATLGHLIRLTHPRTLHGVQRPGWWVAHDPDPALPTPGGHANLGTAHGAAGILAVLALAAGHGHHVPGLTDAIHRLTAFFDTWAQPGPHGPWWPHWITTPDLTAGELTAPSPGRPSWCYGTPGIARALQLAAIATNDNTRQAAAEHTLAASLSPANLDQITDIGLCHGIAGIYQTAHRAAADARTPAIADRLAELAHRLQQLPAEHDRALAGGILTGHPGVQLARDTATEHHSTGWDTCLLIT